MIGAILGDIIGSTREARPIKSETFKLFTNFSRFTDDTVLTVATARAVLDNNIGNFDNYYKAWGLRYINAGYGETFIEWLLGNESKPYNSFGNGSAMRVSPIGWAYDTLEHTIEVAKMSAECTHNHPEGIKGAVAVAGAIYLARTGKSKQEIKQWVEDECGYNLDRPYRKVKQFYEFDVTCQGSVPEAIICFLSSSSCIGAIRKAVALGGDADTQAAIAGSIAEAYYGIPNEFKDMIFEYIPKDIAEVLIDFEKKYK